MDQEQKTPRQMKQAMTTRIAKSLYARHLKGEKVHTTHKWADLDKRVAEDRRIEEERKNLPDK